MVDLFFGIMFLGAAYGLGSLSPAYLVARRVKNVDIRTIGSLNAGALNVFRELGFHAGIFVLAADITKGALVVVSALWLGLAEWTVFSAPVALIIGHNWPAVLQFQGGRGLAPVLGVSLVMLPMLTLLAILPALGVIALSRSVVLSAIVGLVLINALTLATAQSLAFVVTCAVLTALVGGTHFFRSWRRYMGAARSRNWPSVLQVE